MLKKKNNKNSLRVNREKQSGLASFTERPVPTENEVASFEEVVEREARHQEIDANLTEIYSNRKGDLVDVKRLKARLPHNIIVRIFRPLLTLTILALAAYFAYVYFFTGSSDLQSVSMTLSAPEQVLAGEEFSYEIEYHNPTRMPITGVRLELRYPENFIFSESLPLANSANNGFDLPDLAAGTSGKVLVKGRLIGKVDSVNVISARLNYTPLNFSSEFKKEGSDATVISGLGFQVSLEQPPLAFIGQDNEIALVFFDLIHNHLDDFLLKFSVPEKVSLRLSEEGVQVLNSGAANTANVTVDGQDNHIKISSDGTNAWLLSELNQASAGGRLEFKYQIKDLVDNQGIGIRLEKRLPDGQTYLFWEKTVKPELVKSDLNLTLIAGESKNNNSASFSDTINYTINYSNQGENTFKDGVIMAVLDGALFDWNSLRLETEAEVSTGRIVWDKTRIPSLIEIKPGDSGQIKFSIRLKDYQSEYLGSNLDVSAYVQHGAGGQEDANAKSNVIVTRLNSNLSIDEKIRYFDENNIPVGSGPLPPRVDETSTFRVYWTIKNDLHELSQTEVLLYLPSYVSFAEGAMVDAGLLNYDADRQVVIWQVGRLPLSAGEVKAAFNISLTPTSDDINKILVLSPGASVTAVDNETQAALSSKASPKTTRLEDDDIANLSNSGRIE